MSDQIPTECSVTFKNVSNTDASGPKKPPFFADTVSVTTEGSTAAVSAKVNRVVVSCVDTCSSCAGTLQNKRSDYARLAAKALSHILPECDQTASSLCEYLLMMSATICCSGPPATAAGAQAL